MTQELGGNAIFEIGSNANGNYIKFIDGTLLCYYIRNNVNLVSNTGQQPLAGLWFFNANITYPAECIGGSTVLASGAANSAAYAITDVFESGNINATLTQFTFVSSLPGVTIVAYAILGRWK